MGNGWWLLEEVDLNLTKVKDALSDSGKEKLIHVGVGPCFEVLTSKVKDVTVNALN